MYHRALVPPEFVVPDGLACGTYHLRMLSIHDVTKDFEAVIASRERVAGLLDPESSWPQGLTPEEDLIDLAWHQREFTLRHSFAYTVMAIDESRCLGCVYIFPSNAPAFDAAAFYWVRSGADAEAHDADLGARFQANGCKRFQSAHERLRPGNATALKGHSLCSQPRNRAPRSASCASASAPDRTQ